MHFPRAQDDLTSGGDVLQLPASYAAHATSQESLGNTRERSAAPAAILDLQPAVSGLPKLVSRL